MRSLTQGRGEQLQDEIEAHARHMKVRQAARNAANGFHRQLQQRRDRSAKKQSENVARHALNIPCAEQNNSHRMRAMNSLGT
jgi:hypothetical protein